MRYFIPYHSPYYLTTLVQNKSMIFVHLFYNKTQLKYLFLIFIRLSCDFFFTGNTITCRVKKKVFRILNTLCNFLVITVTKTQRTHINKNNNKDDIWE